MTTKTDTDTELTQRCASILTERAKKKSEPIDCVHIARLLREDSSACYRALHRVPGIIVDGTKGLAKFSVQL